MLPTLISHYIEPGLYTTLPGHLLSPEQISKVAYHVLWSWWLCRPGMGIYLHPSTESEWEIGPRSEKRHQLEGRKRGSKLVYLCRSVTQGSSPDARAISITTMEADCLNELTESKDRETKLSNVSPTKVFHLANSISFSIGSSWINISWPLRHNIPTRHHTLCCRKIPNPTSFITDSTSTFHFPSVISPNQAMICVDTILGIWWSSARVDESLSTCVASRDKESDTNKFKKSSRSWPRYEGAIGLSSPT